MRSSTGKHYVALDHLRAIAAFMVVCWHFGHVTGPSSLGTAPALAFLEEGHVGVALFMTLSGYLFAKLLGGSRIAILPFLWNRFLRLAPLLIVVLTVEGVLRWMAGTDPLEYVRTVLTGFVFPTLLQKGTWSIAVELHFYLLLPVLLWLVRNWAPGMLLLLLGGVAIRYGVYQTDPEYQAVIFRTIVGRSDQFICGMIAFHYSRLVNRRVAAAALLTFLAGYTAFDMAGGYYRLPEPWKAVWIILPTFEGACFAAIIAWYDRNPIKWPAVSNYLRRAGEYSYSIYLLHFFFFATAAKAVDMWIMDISNFYLVLPWIVVFFAIAVQAGQLSYRFIEAPFLCYRKPYLLAHRAKRPIRVRARRLASD